MNLNKNYYAILGVDKTSDEKTIKKSYYKLSKKYHPDKGGDSDVFSEIVEAYTILTGYSRTDYDLKSEWGANYNETYELYNININLEYDDVKSSRETFKRNEVNDIIIKVDDDFSGTIEFERWVKCLTCDGTGRDFSSKIVIRDNLGKILKVFEAEDGCDFCDGTGKWNNSECTFCNGKGKVGINDCKKCNGEKRILGKQKLKNIKLTGDKTKVKSMGNHAKNGNVGDLYLIKNYLN